MRFGAPVHKTYANPEEWAENIKKAGYKVANCPVDIKTDEAEILAYKDMAEKVDIIIAEVGVWNNPLVDNKEVRKTAVQECKQHLELADKIGARCCVNIAGSRGKIWDGPDFDNLTQKTFEMIVDITREIIDDVKPVNTYYTLEPMPWIYPDSPDSYLKLIKAIDRERFAVHLDPVNMINCPERYFNNGIFLKECFNKLGPYIKSCHLKDIMMDSSLTVHLQEVRPGQGELDIAVFLQEAEKLDKDLPVLLEHLPDAGQYQLAADYVYGIAEKNKISI